MPIQLLRGGDDRVAPLVCVHPVSGSVDAYRPLAGALAWAGPILGALPGEPAGDTAYRLDELARAYRSELDLARPALLVGWSLGGVIAAELAHQIVAAGGTVAFLGIIDARAPVPEMRARPTDRDTLARFFVRQWALEREHEPPPPPAASDAATLLATLRAAGLADELADEADLEHRLVRYLALTRAFFLHHVQQPIPVPVQLFDAQEAHPSHPKPHTLGWEDHAPRVDKHPVPGTHFTALRPRHVPALARAIDRCLASL